ncbi:MAG: transglycosylase SLT domain-containing protein [Balneolales bacterium]|nr:transglycosylase SLT domain-containing protein [Balneolales bacterium]
MLAQLNSQLQHATAQGWIPFFEQAASRHNVPIDVLLAVASRETDIGTSRLFVMYQGDFTNGVGLMQIDRRWHSEFTERVRPNDHAAIIDYGASLLSADYKRLKNWQHAAAAYNAGPGRVANAVAARRDPDEITTGGNYGKDVMARAQIIAEILWPDQVHSPGAGGFTAITNPERFQAMTSAAALVGIGLLFFTLNRIR